MKSESIFEWEEGDCLSFEDSDRFEEDSLCSWISEPESLCNNWRGWKKPGVSGLPSGSHVARKSSSLLPLVELAARAVASHIPFELVEDVYPAVPEEMQLRIAFWSFPENEEDIRLYSCLANGSSEEFSRGESIFRSGAVVDPLQIGFHLSATVLSSVNVPKGSYFNVAVTFDRGRITSCHCTCSSSASWCAHVVALCLYRIHNSKDVCLRAPVSESLSRLRRDQLQKFAQYLISELPQQILPTAQRLLDELLSSQSSAINNVCGAPDPTAGASINEQTSWCLDDNTLHDNIRKILIKFCVPSPMVFSDVNYLSSTAPPAATEWSNLLRPLRGREPEGMWNLLSIVREMFRRHDRNAVPLLQILTEECLACEQILVWWFNTKVALHNGNNGYCGKSNVNSNSHASQHACSSLCDEIVILWRLAALNPALSPQELKDLEFQLKQWHLFTLEKVGKSKSTGSGSSNSKKMDKIDVDVFPGFKPAIEACLLDWIDYPISGVTYSAWSRMYRCPVSCLKQHENSNRNDVNQVNCSQVVLNGEHPPHLTKRPRNVDFLQERVKGCLPIDRQPKVGISPGQDGNRSSVSSEGFCDNDSEVGNRDSQSDSVDETQTSHCSGQACGKSENNFTVCYGDDVFSNTLNASESSLNHKDAYCPDGNDIDSDCSGAVDTLCQLDSVVEGKCDSIRQVCVNDIGGSVADEFNLYQFDLKVKLVGAEIKQSDQNKKEDIFSGIRKFEDSLEILFARAEALHAHGHGREACKLAVKLAEELLAKPPVLTAEPSPPAKGKRKKVFKYTVQPASHQVSQLASATLAKTTFLCNVLSENSDHFHLAFKVGMFGLEMARPPASTKALEVKLANQESDIVGLLKRIPLGPAELSAIREKAELLRDGTLRSRGEALLPLMLASYIFDALVLPGATNRHPSQIAHRNPCDEMLGFEAALAALGLKANVSEYEHPILCEGIRRQRGDFAVTLLVHYKDDKDKLAKLMDRLLDKEVHQMYKAKSLSSYYATRPNNGWYSTSPLGATNLETPFDDKSSAEASKSSAQNPPQPLEIEQKLSTMSLQENMSNNYMACRGARSKELNRNVRHRDNSPTWEEDYKEWEAKFRCANLKTPKRHSNGMASIDSSAPETTSSDNSPTLIRRYLWSKPSGPGSDSGSSGKSSDSLGSFSSGDKIPRDKITPRENESPPLSFTPKPNPIAHDSGVSAVNRSASCTNLNTKINRYKGKRAYPTIPNQPSEASAHFMFELANTVLKKAGGNSSTSLFTQPTSSQNPRGPHRNLHMCAFQIGLYSLGLHNCVSPNWLSRTYSSHVSWVTGQAIEIGANAISFLIDTWEGHLTPPEIASLADRISRSRDPILVKAAVELALSCLPHAHALNPSEIQRAILQCKEQSISHLEKACLAVESAAKGDGVSPEVLFYVARRWYDLYEQHNQRGHCESAADNSDVFVMENSGSILENLNLEMGINQHQIIPHTLPVSVTQPQPSTSNPGLAYLHHPFQLSLPYSMYNFVPGFSPQIGQVPFPMYLPASSFQYGTNNVGVNVSVNMGLGLGQQYPSVMGSPQTLQFFSPSNLRPIGPGTHQSTPNGNGILPIAIQPTNPEMMPVRQPMSVHNIATVQSDTLSASSVPSTSAPGSVTTRSVQPINQALVNYSLSAYRVGMLAMETLARRVHDDRPQFKYSKAPPYGADVKWLLGVAKRLGSHYVNQFCICTLNSVVSPFVLYEIAMEAAHFTSKSSGGNVLQHLRSPFLAPLVQKCQQMFIQCTHHKLYHITPPDYEEFISIIKSAKAAFQMTPGGLVQFSELLQSLKRSKSCRKDLWVKIANNLQQSSTV